MNSCICRRSRTWRRDEINVEEENKGAVKTKSAVGGLRSKDGSCVMARKQNYGGEMGPNESRR